VHDNVADIRAGARLLGLTPYAIETLLVAVRRAGERAGREISVGVWLSAAVLSQNQAENPPLERLAAHVPETQTAGNEREKISEPHWTG
jgi:hypothetical protein